MATTTPRKPRGSYAKTAARRQEILDAAIEVFSASGFRNGSLRDVADRVGLSQAGLLHHFPSKEHLLQAVLARRDEETAQRMGEPAPEGLDLVRALVAVAEYNATTPGLVELHVVLSAEATAEDHPVHDYFVRRYARVLAFLQRGFESAAAAGQLRPDVDCASAATTLIALMDGLQVQWLLHREAVDMAGDIRRYVQSLLTVDL